MAPLSFLSRAPPCLLFPRWLLHSAATAGELARKALLHLTFLQACNSEAAVFPPAPAPGAVHTHVTQTHYVIEHLLVHSWLPNLTLNVGKIHLHFAVSKVHLLSVCLIYGIIIPTVRKHRAYV